MSSWPSHVQQPFIWQKRSFHKAQIAHRHFHPDNKYVDSASGASRLIHIIANTHIS
jgi:hypothetical protein